MKETMFHLPVLLLQVCVILATARAVGWLFRRMHQPQVIGEMLAGIMLGPSLLGWLAPSASATLFPPESLGFINSLSQVGVLLFIFLVGLELNPYVLRGQGRAAVVTSWTSIIAPFGLGILLALVMYPRLGTEGKGFLPFALFIGTAMSVTAFPVLARILTENDLLRTRLGALTIACAAVDDVTAWFLLAIVVVLVKTNEAGLPIEATILGSLVYIGSLIFIVRKAFRKFELAYNPRRIISHDMLAIILIIVFVSAWITEWLGIHALFGAFLIGAIMPKDQRFVHALTEKLEDLAVVLLLPLFFAFNGLRTDIGSLNGIELWVFCVLIIAVAIAGKLGGSTIAARMTGSSWRDASALGILMNTRGLVELVILNVGLDLGVISKPVFTMMVLMALTTTFMTSPLLNWIYLNPLKRERAAVVEAQRAEDTVPSV